MNEGDQVILRHLLEEDERGVCCWMCFDCLRSLERGVVPKGTVANNLWIGDVPSQLAGLTIPEQLLIVHYYPRCYIFKLFPHNHDSHIPIEQFYMGMAGNASLFAMDWLKQTFRVRRHVIHEALVWLQKNNPIIWIFILMEVG
jgi:hypothetical protein